MFDSALVVSTAVSSFNNAALLSPYFFVVGIFCIPLFLMCFWYGSDLMNKIGWSNHDVESRTGVLSVACLALWLLICGGNYAVIRDSVSLLPSVIAIVLFISVVFLINSAKRLGYMDRIKNIKLRWFIFLSVLILAAFSAMPTWWGILLQLSAILCGMIVGDRLHIKMSDMFISTVVFCLTTGLVLMQPEYFRFGQLGNLTFIHIIALLLCGFFGITTLVAKYTNARSRIYNSAYVKLRWLCRILAILAFVLFLSTESVPVFVALVGVCGISEMLYIYHGNQDLKKISEQAWAMMLITFGIIVICPPITILGIIYLASKNTRINLKDFVRLL